ncbi:DUF2190 family protein [Enterocloster sp.]|uniref:DUF2190 family protein n=1 Tax=Enterocloster sp. TaxID=2719315 RepID=UPI00399F288A
MKAVYVQRGEALDYANTTGKDIGAGDVVVFGKRIGIAGMPIPAGGLGTIHMTGVFRVPKKASEAIEAGADVYYTEDGFSAAAAVGVSDMEESQVGTAKAGEATVAAEAAPAVAVAAGYAVKKAEAEEGTMMVNLG